MRGLHVDAPAAFFASNTLGDLQFTRRRLLESRRAQDLLVPFEIGASKRADSAHLIFVFLTVSFSLGFVATATDILTFIAITRVTSNSIGNSTAEDILEHTAAFHVQRSFVAFKAMSQVANLHWTVTVCLLGVILGVEFD